MQVRCFSTLTVIIGVIICIFPFAHAQEPVLLTNAQGQYPLGRYLAILEDPQKQFSIEDIRSPEFAGRFTISQADTPNFGYTHSAYWVRFQVNNRAPLSTQWRLVMSFPNMNHIELYSPEPTCQDTADPVSACNMVVARSGNLLPFTQRQIPYHHFVFPLTLPPDMLSTMYLRFENKGAMTLPLTIWSLEAFARQSQVEHLWLGLFYGVLCIMIGYNLFLSFSLKNSNHVYYVLFLLTYLLYQASFDGLASQYFWPGYAGINGFIVTVGAGLTIFAALRFADSFLLLPRMLPRFHRVAQILAWFDVGLTLLAPFVEVSTIIKLMAVVALAAIFLIVLGATMAWRQSYRPARYFLLAWSAFLFTMVLQLLSRSGVLPSTSLTEYSDRAGAMLLVLLLSLALADQIRDIHSEKDVAQAEALRLKDELNAALQQTKAELENRVTAQHDELNRANAEIQLLNQVMQSAAQLGDASTGLTDISVHIAADAEYMANRVATVSSNSQQTNQLIHELSEATEHVAANIQEISRTVAQVVQKITQALERANMANTTIIALKSHSQEIDNIIKLITNIAQQTNLLALNATIEAARAGETGRGFTVVAGEVKELARETSTSAEDIAHRIETIQGSSQEATTAITDVVEAMRQVANLSHTISAAINQQSMMATTISGSLVQAAEGSRDISHAMTDLSSTARDASERATTIQAEAQKLFALAVHLRTLVDTAQHADNSACTMSHKVPQDWRTMSSVGSTTETG
ncbi:sensor histidine kinase [Candidatus Vecturithrix granuli]|uniref:Sensor histidine kinase n=1 Tax=Vecturithrix granuli TaxID=1499967 RepID=A0A081C2F8_VECG1|nr:sensor histidine kinase [Candidatus Vecturithrix granuli]